MRFSKWHAVGNSYVVVEQPDAGALDPARVQSVCDTQTGIGADGVIEVVERNADRLEIVIWNPDGTVAEMSGNGVRIAACWLAAGAGDRRITVTTSTRHVEVEILPGGLARAEHEVAVGAPERLEVDGPVDVVPASVGNPHAVVRMAAPTRADLLRLGPLLESHPRFPERTNVQLVEVLGPHELAVLVWERGAGETASSGSSSVAAAAVAVASGWCESPVTVRLPGGFLLVEISGAKARLTGPASETCRGTTSL